MSSEKGLNGEGKHSDALAHSKQAEYTEHELIMNQIKAAWSDHVSEDGEICLHTWFVGVKIMFVILMGSIDAVLFLLDYIGRYLERDSCQLIVYTRKNIPIKIGI